MRSMVACMGRVRCRGGIDAADGSALPELQDLR
jgi:hypothetical protein